MGRRWRVMRCFLAGHINFLGRYDISLPESVESGNLRPLRDPTSAGVF